MSAAADGRTRAFNPLVKFVPSRTPLRLMSCPWTLRAVTRGTTSTISSGTRHAKLTVREGRGVAAEAAFPLSVQCQHLAGCDCRSCVMVVIRRRRRRFRKKGKLYAAARSSPSVHYSP